MKDWELVEVTDDDEYTDDQSGVYMLVHVSVPFSQVPIGYVRVDVMRVADDEPLRSFQGDANAVRKAVVEFIEALSLPDKRSIHPLSVQHASYMGQEIQRAALQGSEYVQS